MPAPCGKELSCYLCEQLVECKDFQPEIVNQTSQDLAKNLAKQSPPPIQDYQRGHFGQRGHVSDQAPRHQK